MRSVPAAVLGLLIVGAACTGSSATTTTASPATATSAPAASTTTTTLAEYAWQSGDCLAFTTVNDLDLLPYAPYGAEDVVSCAEFHTHEVFLAASLPEGPTDPFPGDALSARVADTCTEAFTGHAGVSLRDSWYEMIYYLPDADEWSGGERYLACVLFQVGPSGLVRELRGSASGDAAAATWPVAQGDCLHGAVAEPRYGGPVPCSGEHTHEVVADLMYPQAAGVPFPGAGALASLGAERCAAAFAAAGGDPADPAVAVTARSVGRADWDSGYRRLLCVARAVSDGGELLVGTGSVVAGTWQAAGLYRDEPALTA